MSFSLPVTVICWLLGVVAGISISVIFTYFKNRHSKIAGLIEVDDQSNLCKVHVTSTELANQKTKKVLFNVVHNVDLSREEQIL